MDLNEFIRQNEKMNSSLITDWNKEMLLEAFQIWTKKQCDIQRVSQQRELLKAFLEHIESTVDFLPCEPSELIDDYLNSL